jgi:hypothetical protein
MPSCNNCSGGIWCNGTATNNSTPCIAGYFCAPGKPPALCPPGYKCPKGSSEAEPCVAETFTSGGEAACRVCKTDGGFYCPGASDALKCSPGSFAAQGRSLSACEPCAIGRWTGRVGADNCERCKAGTYGINPNGTTQFEACADCDENTFSFGGTGSCIQCAKGVGGPRGSGTNCTSECLPNEVTTGTEQKDSPRPYCRTCDVGKGEAPNSKQDACETGTIICPAGQMLSFGRRRCDPLVCPSPLVIFNVSEAIARGIDKSIAAKCVGCRNGTVGKYPECAPCGTDSGDLCIGPTSRKLADLLNASAYNVTACPTLKGLQSASPPVALPPLDLPLPCKDERIRLTGTCAYDAAIVALITLCSLFATLPLCARLSHMRWLDKILCAADMFNMSGNVPDNGWPIKRPTAVGGACTCAGIFTLATATAVLIALQSDRSNVAISRSVDVFDESEKIKFNTLKFNVDKAPSSPWRSGLQVRITASCEPGSLVLNSAPVGSDAVTPPLINASDGTLTAGSWAADNTEGTWALDNATLVDGVPRVCDVDNTTTQLIFRCDECTFKTTSTLSVALPYSCQSLLIEAAALNATNAVTVLQANSTQTRGSSSGRLLTKVEWKVKLLASVVDHLVRARTTESARGYTFAGEELSVTSNTLVPITGLAAILNMSGNVTRNTTTLVPIAGLLAARNQTGNTTGNVTGNVTENAAGNATALSPAAEAVEVIIAFPLEPYYVNMVVKERVDIQTLLTSIAGLASIFAVFGIGRDLLHTLFPANERNVVAARAAELAELRDSIRAELLAELRTHGVLPALDGAAHGALPAPDGAARGALPAPDGAALGALPAPDGAAHDALPAPALPAPDGAAHNALPEPDGAARGALPAPDGASRGAAAVAAGAFAAAQKHSTLSKLFLDSARAAARQLQPPQDSEAPADGAFMFQNPLRPALAQRLPEEAPL